MDRRPPAETDPDSHRDCYPFTFIYSGADSHKQPISQPFTYTISVCYGHPNASAYRYDSGGRVGVTSLGALQGAGVQSQQ